MLPECNVVSVVILRKPVPHVRVVHREVIRIALYQHGIVAVCRHLLDVVHARLKLFWAAARGEAVNYSHGLLMVFWFLWCFVYLYSQPNPSGNKYHCDSGDYI